MRKIISLSMGVALAVTVFAAVPAAAESATVTRGGDCGMPGIDSAGVPIRALDENGEDINGTVKKLVQNDNYWIMTCQATGLPNGLGRKYEISGFGCRIELPEGYPGGDPDGDWLVTDDSRFMINKKGNATMKCTAPFVDVPVVEDPEVDETAE